MRKLPISAFALASVIVLLALFLQSCAADDGGVVGAPTPASTGALVRHSVPTRTSLSQAEGNPQWVRLASPYVHVSNYTALVDPKISQKLDVRVVTEVQQAVLHYNALPLRQRQTGVTIPASAFSTGVKATACRDEAKTTLNWWGVTIYMNHCLAGDVGDGLGIAAGLVGILSGLGIDLPLDALAGVLGGEAALIALEDRHCGDQGVNLNIDWLLDVWPTPVC